MSYTTNASKDITRKEMFVVLKPRKRVSSWTLDTGSVYYAAFDHGTITSVAVNGTALTLGTSTSLSAGQYYQDQAAGRLYIRKSDSTAPASTDWIVITFELYFATFETMWHRVPTDTTTDQVFFRGIITQPPVISQASDQNIFGFSPVQDTTMGCQYDPEYLQELLHDVTFNKAEIVVYHMLGDLDESNIVKIFTGIGGRHSSSDDSLQIDILDKSFILDQPMNNVSSADLYPDTVEPISRLAPISIYFGPSRQFRCVCIDFDNTSPTTSQNRKWAAFTNGHTGDGGGLLGTVSSARLFANNTSYSLSGLYTNTVNLDLSLGLVGVELGTNTESSLGISTINPDSDFVVITRQPIETIQTLGGSGFDFHTTPKSPRIIYHILRRVVGLPESEINTSSFTTADSAISSSRYCQVLIPDVDESEFPTVKDVIIRLCATDFLRSYFDKDGKFKIKLIEQASTTPALELTDDDLIDARFDYDTNDIYKVIVQFIKTEYYNSNWKTGATGYVQYENNNSSTYTGTDYLHQEDRVKTIKTYGYDSGTGLQTYINKFGQLLGERRGLLSCFVKSGAFQLELGDTVKISRKKLPGYEYDGTTENSRSYVVTEIRKQIDGVFLVLDDQKVIEDNSGDW